MNIKYNLKIKSLKKNTHESRCIKNNQNVDKKYNKYVYTHTHTHIYIYNINIYIYIRVYIYIYIWNSNILP